jgi:squalene-hopene/tetraprenyl-beta-curcumene cyclase
MHDAKKHADAMTKAAGFLRKMQFFEGGVEGRVVQKADLRYGGMGYGSDPTQPDLSNSQFALESLRAAGVPEDDPAFQRALVYLRRTQNRKENETEGEPASRGAEDGKVIVHAADGGATYRPFDSKAGNFERPDGKLEARSYGSMTYALLKCYLYAGLKADDPRVRDAAKWIREHYTWEENPGFSDPKGAQQGLFYYYATGARTLAMLDAAGPEGAGAWGKPVDWKGDLARKLLAIQKPDGSWENGNDRWMEAVPEVATAFALKALSQTAR